MSADQAAERENATARRDRLAQGREIAAEVKRQVQEQMAKIAGQLGSSPGQSGSSGPVEPVVGDTESGDPTGGGQWPSTHAARDAIGAEEGVDFDEGDKVADKIAKLKAAGVEPPPE